MRKSKYPEKALKEHANSTQKGSSQPAVFILIKYLVKYALVMPTFFLQFYSHGKKVKVIWVKISKAREPAAFGKIFFVLTFGLVTFQKH